MIENESKNQAHKDYLGLRRLYNWMMTWAEHKYGVHALGFLSVIEAIFFPIPVDPLLVAMGVSKPKRALWYAFITSACSVGGAFIGYLVGLYFWEHTQGFFYQYVFSQEKMELVLNKFNDNAFLAIFLAGFTPIPFKVFTISAGVANLNLLPFFAGSIIGRSLRYFILGGLIFKFGVSIRDFIDRHFTALTIAVGAIVVLLAVIYKMMI